MSAPRPVEDASGNTSERPRPAKRARVAVACQRCKSRKQKCDGKHPTCGNCQSFNKQCEYVMPTKSAAGREHYYRTLEERLAELEHTIAREGIKDAQRPAWQRAESFHATELDSAPSRRQSKASSTSPNFGAVIVAAPAEDSFETGSVNSVTEILRDLSIEASGGYIGASSNITMGRMIGSLVKAKEHALSANGKSIEEHLSPKSLYQPSSPPTSIGSSGIPLMSPEVCDQLLTGYLKHISLRWPILRTSFIRALHLQRDTISDPYRRSVLHLIYAIGGRFLETTGQTGNFYPEEYHADAVKHLDEILQYHDSRSIEILLLLSIHSLRAPKGPGAWTYVGLAMRLCIDLGLHRKTAVKNGNLLDVEMRKRIFWTCYCLDRQVSIILGRPFAISDRDIDAELPIDIDEDIEDDALLAQALAAANTSTGAAARPTSLSCFIHICRLRIIESNIQQSIYRVDEPAGASETEVQRYIGKLEQWKAAMPVYGVDRPVQAEAESTMIDGHDYYMVYYYKCMRFLLHPHLSSQNPNPEFLQKCVQACGGVCQTYKRLHQSVSVGFSLMALHSVFLAGLTLIYCTWISPREVFSISTSNDMNACSIVLYIITERWPGAKKYRDVFENVKQTVLDSIEESSYQPRRAIKKLRPSLRTTLRTMDKGEEGQMEFSAMVADMAGEAAFADAGDTPPTTSTATFPQEPFQFVMPFDIPGPIQNPQSGATPTAFSNWMLDTGIDAALDLPEFDVDAFADGAPQFQMD